MIQNRVSSRLPRLPFKPELYNFSVSGRKLRVDRAQLPHFRGGNWGISVSSFPDPWVLGFPTTLPRNCPPETFSWRSTAILLPFLQSLSYSISSLSYQVYLHLSRPGSKATALTNSGVEFLVQLLSLAFHKWGLYWPENETIYCRLVLAGSSWDWDIQSQRMGLGNQRCLLTEEPLWPGKSWHSCVWSRQRPKRAEEECW